MFSLYLPRPAIAIDPHASYELAVTENPRNAGSTGSGGRRKRSLGATGKLWLPGRTLTVSFLKVKTPSLKSDFYALARQWIDLSNANLNLELVDDDDMQADLRVATNPGAYYSWAACGTDALSPEHANLPNVSLGLTSEHELYQYNALHEFGHVFGADHEHLHPDADIPWDEAMVISTYMAEWSTTEQDVRSNFLDKREDVGLIKTDYDTSSVMHYPVEQRFTVGDWECGINNALSEKDCEFMRLAYPHD
ncbi:M12 family metallopeptidase [Pseudomonas aegrilactucae]|uniref:Peptidase M12 n=1 Tax=Pseudomonas aegrilactucae TaxID=2854028 RepID=A0A9Q2XMF2_9PSED|nr:M12 family metallopeptidase [Pseudomonas aegrilactucae]MBV6288969.1 peptidase M12 [Pseudomonas aegrilactucae]